MAAVAWWGPAPTWLTVVLAAGGLPALVVHGRRGAALALLVAAALGLARAGHHAAVQPPIFDAPPGAMVRLQGIVVDTRPGARRTLQLESATFWDPSRAQAVSGRVTVFQSSAVARPGARVTVEGSFEPARRAPGWQAAAAEAYVGEVSQASIRTLDPSAGASAAGWLTDLRHHLDRSVRAVLPEPHGALLSATLVGVRAGVPNDVWADFATSGLTHVIAISGFNITLIALAVRRGAGWLLGRYGVVAAAVLLPVYAVLSGAEPSAVRATIMGEVVLLAWILGRDADTLTALALAGTGMTLVHPEALRDLGFLLSFAGTLGLIVLSDPLAGALQRRAHLPRWLAEPLAVTASAMLLIVPLVAHVFGRFQLLAIPINLIALVAPPWIMATGVPIAAWAALGLPGADVLSWVAWLPLEYLLRTAQLGATIPGASIPVANFDLGATALTYACIAAALLLLGRPRWPRLEGPRRIWLPRRVLYAGAGLLLAAPPLAVAAGAPRVWQDNATAVAIDFGGRTPTVYLRHGDVSVAVAGSAADAARLDAALPPWDATIDALVIPTSGGSPPQRGLALLAERPVAMVYAPDPHALGWSLVTPDGRRRTPVRAVEAAQVSDAVFIEFAGAPGERWTIVRSPHVRAAIAPPGRGEHGIPAGLTADILVLGRQSGPAALEPAELARAGVQLVVAPHPLLARFVTRAVLPDGSIVRPSSMVAAEGFAGNPVIRVDGQTLRVTLPA